MPILATAALGAFCGAVVGWLMRENNLKHYKSGLTAGKTTVAVRHGDRKDEVGAVFERHDAAKQTASKPMT